MITSKSIQGFMQDVMSKKLLIAPEHHIQNICSWYEKYIDCSLSDNEKADFIYILEHVLTYNGHTYAKHILYNTDTDFYYTEYFELDPRDKELWKTVINNIYHK